MMKLILSLMLLPGLIACSASISEPIQFFQVQTPRPFGYVIGDVIEQRIRVKTRAGIPLQPASLPTVGQLNRWLQVKQVIISSEKSNIGGDEYLIILQYQLINAPQTVTMLAVPAFKLNFGTNQQTIEQTVPTWHFSAGPVRELAIRKDESGEYMRPFAPPGTIEDPQSRYLLYLSLSIFTVAAARLAWHAGWFPGVRGRTVFSRAGRRIGNLNSQQMEQALSALHEAFNTLNQKPLFKGQLADFYRRHPDYRDIASELEWFFQYSERFFFGTPVQADPVDLNRIKMICRQCRQIERSSL